MDVNLTYPIASNAYPIAANVTLNQPWWIPALNLAAGLIGALVGAAAIYFVARYEKGKEIEKHIRDEHKIAYRNLLSTSFQFVSFRGNEDMAGDLIDFKEFYKKYFDTIAEFQLIASPEVAAKFGEVRKQYLPLKDSDNLYKFSEAIITEVSPLMRDEINY